MAVAKPYCEFLHPQEQFIGRVVCFFPVFIAKTVEIAVQTFFVSASHLDADKHPAIGGAMVAVMKQTDVPALPDTAEKL